MPTLIPCPSCSSMNKPDALRCHACGRKLQDAPAATPSSSPVTLQRVTSGEVFTAVIGDSDKRGAGSGKSDPPTPAPVVQVVAAETPVPPDVPAVEDHSDVIAAAVDGIRAAALKQGNRFKPYAASKTRKGLTDQAKQEVAKHVDVAVGLFRETRFEAALEPLLKAIARDDEDRRTWILLAEAYLRLGQPYKAAVGYLRALELSPKDEQAWLGLGRVLRMLGDLPTASAVLERAARIHPQHAETWVERGLILESLQKLPEAARSFAKVLEIRPDHRLAKAKREEIESQLAKKGVPAVPATPGAVPSKAAGSDSTMPTAEEERERDILDEMETALAKETAAKKAAQTAPVPSHAPAARPARVRTFAEGLDETLEGGIPWGHVVLVEGAPGTMKSSLAFSILLQNAAREDLHCVYLSLEERASSLLKQMGSLGLKLEVRNGSLVVLDPRTATNLMREKTDWIDALREGISTIKEQRGLDLVAIDSLEALEVLAKFKDRRREMYRLFEWLRDLGVTSLVITERPDWVVAGHVLQGRWDEDFLADGVFHLRMHMVSEVETQRRLRVVKMRGTKHETGYLAMILDDGRFRVTRAMSS